MLSRIVWLVLLTNKTLLPKLDCGGKTHTVQVQTYKLVQIKPWGTLIHQQVETSIEEWNNCPTIKCLCLYCTVNFILPATENCP